MNLIESMFQIKHVAQLLENYKSQPRPIADSVSRENLLNNIKPAMDSLSRGVTEIGGSAGYETLFNNVKNKYEDLKKAAARNDSRLFNARVPAFADALEKMRDKLEIPAEISEAFNAEPDSELPINKIRGAQQVTLNGKPLGYVLTTRENDQHLSKDKLIDDKIFGRSNRKSPADKILDNTKKDMPKRDTVAILPKSSLEKFLAAINKDRAKQKDQIKPIAEEKDAREQRLDAKEQRSPAGSEARSGKGEGPKVNDLEKKKTEKSNDLEKKKAEKTVSLKAEVQKDAIKKNAPSLPPRDAENIMRVYDKYDILRGTLAAAVNDKHLTPDIASDFLNNADKQLIGIKNDILNSKFDNPQLAQQMLDRTDKLRDGVLEASREAESALSEKELSDAMYKLDTELIEARREADALMAEAQRISETEREEAARLYEEQQEPPEPMIPEEVERAEIRAAEMGAAAVAVAAYAEANNPSMSTITASRNVEIELSEFDGKYTVGVFRGDGSDTALSIENFNSLEEAKAAYNLPEEMNIGDRINIESEPETFIRADADMTLDTPNGPLEVKEGDYLQLNEAEEPLKVVDAEEFERQYYVSQAPINDRQAGDPETVIGGSRSEIASNTLTVAEKGEAIDATEVDRVLNKTDIGEIANKDKSVEAIMNMADKEQSYKWANEVDFELDPKKLR